MKLLAMVKFFLPQSQKIQALDVKCQMSNFTFANTKNSQIKNKINSSNMRGARNERSLFGAVHSKNQQNFSNLSRS